MVISFHSKIYEGGKDCYHFCNLKNLKQMSRKKIVLKLGDGFYNFNQDANIIIIFLISVKRLETKKCAKLIVASFTLSCKIIVYILR